MATFFDLLPRDTTAAARLARRHDTRVKGRAAMTTDRRRPLRHALEVRHKSFETPEFIDLLREHDIGLVVADTAGKWPFLEDLTSNFVYVRLHGDKKLYTSGYTSEALRRWATKIRSWAHGQAPRSSHRISSPARPDPARPRCLCLFRQRRQSPRPFDAMSLAHRLGLGPKPERVPEAKSVREKARRHWPEVPQHWRMRIVREPASSARALRALRIRSTC